MFDFILKPIVQSLAVAGYVLGASFEVGKQDAKPVLKCLACPNQGEYRADLGHPACDFCYTQYKKYPLTTPNQ